VKPLATEFTAKGWSFRQIERKEHAAIYRRERECAWDYEVIVVRQHDGHIWPNGDITPPGERYPPDSQWGILGWTFSSASHRNPAKAARAKFDALP
jgi:hypothetical protein